MIHSPLYLLLLSLSVSALPFMAGQYLHTAVAFGLFSTETAFLAILLRFLNKPKIATVIISACALFCLFADFESLCESFNQSTASIWNLSTNYWWGPILFAIIPLLVVAVAATLGYNFFSLKRYTKKTWFTTIVVMLCILPFGNSSLYNLLQEKSIPEPEISTVTTQKRLVEQWDKNKNPFHPSRPTLAVLVESLGASQDHEKTKELLSAYSFGKPTFSGISLRNSAHTQGAELEDFKLMTALKDSVFQKWYVHGYDGSFYRRQANYSKVGFDSLLFKEDFEQRGLPICKLGFTGICDSSIVEFIDKLMSDSIPKYIYWTTLDTHPPYDDNTPGINEAEIFMKRQQNTARYIAQLAIRHPEYQIVVRGDHSPMTNFQKGKLPTFLYRWVPLVIFN